ncbi:hypothetical protein [Streptomyces sp. NPDC001502]
MNTPAPTTPPNPPTAAAEPPAVSPPEEPTPMKKMAILVSLSLATAAAVIALFLTRHYGAEPLISLGSAGVTFIGTYNLAQNILEKLGYL